VLGSDTYINRSRAFTLMELLITLALVVVVISLAYTYSGSSRALSSRKLDEMGALGNSRRILQCLNHEIKSTARVLLPSKENPRSKYMVRQNQQGQWIQFFFDSRGRFCSRVFGGDPSKVRVRVAQPMNRVVLHRKEFLLRDKSELEFYLVYRQLENGQEEDLIEVFDSFSL